MAIFVIWKEICTQFHALNILCTPAVYQDPQAQGPHGSGKGVGGQGPWAAASRSPAACPLQLITVGIQAPPD